MEATLINGLNRSIHPQKRVGKKKLPFCHRPLTLCHCGWNALFLGTNAWRLLAGQYPPLGYRNRELPAGWPVGVHSHGLEEPQIGFVIHFTSRGVNREKAFSVYGVDE